MGEAVSISTVAKPAFLMVTVRGKLVRARRFDNMVQSVILCPAADEFSKPQVLEVRSSRKLGERDDIVVVDCKLGGYERKAFQTTDRETGEVHRIIPVNHTLDAVE